MRVNLSVDTELLKNFDEFCEKYKFERSELISALMRATIYDDFTLKGARTISRKVTGGEQPVPNSATGTKIEEEREPIWENRNYDKVVAKVSYGYCEGHFEKGKEFKRYLISYENQDGVRTVDKRWYCKSCVDLLIEKTKTGGNLLST